jgi:hypothetical protein
MFGKQALHHYTSFHSFTKKLPFPFKFMCLFIVFLCFSLALFNHDYFINGCQKWRCDYKSFCVFCYFVTKLVTHLICCLFKKKSASLHSCNQLVHYLYFYVFPHVHKIHTYYSIEVQVACVFYKLVQGCNLLICIELFIVCWSIILFIVKEVITKLLFFSKNSLFNLLEARWKLWCK